MLALVGFARTILVIRLLSTQEYALLAVAESVRFVVTAGSGLGIGEAVAREGAVEREKGLLLSLISVGLGHTTILAFGSFVVMVLLSIGAPIVVPMDSQFPIALMWAATVVPTERLWGYLQSCMQAMHALRSYTVALFCHGVTIAVFTVIFTAKWGVNGYFAAQALVTGVGVAVLGSLTFVRLGLPKLSTLSSDWRNVSRRLFPMAWFAYVSKCSLILWRRLPIIVGAGWIPPAALGAVAATFDLTSKAHLVQEALAPIILPTLARRFRENPDSFAPAARTELRLSLGTNLLVFAIAALLWLVAGKQVVGIVRWTDVQPLFLGAMAVECVLLVANVIAATVLLPARQVSSRLALVTLVTRVLVAPAIIAMTSLGMTGGPAIILAMLMTGSVVAITYIIRAKQFLRVPRMLP